MTYPLAPPPQTVVAASIRWTVPTPQALPSRVRELLWGTYKELLDPDEMHCIAMAAHELLENIVKYSAEGTSSFDMEIVDGDGGRRVRISTSNDATPEDVVKAKRLVDRISAAPDPMVIYDELIATSPARDGSGLGLARVRAEADMSVVCVAETGRITIVAERGISNKGIV
jgi:hypothetical protein